MCLTITCKVENIPGGAGREVTIMFNIGLNFIGTNYKHYKVDTEPSRLANYFLLIRFFVFIFLGSVKARTIFCDWDTTYRSALISIFSHFLNCL